MSGIALPGPGARLAGGLATSHRNLSLDGIRALAILWVFAFHAHALLGGGLGSASPGSGAALAEAGLLGVQLFFVLSGFLLSLPWMRAAAAGGPRPALGSFYRRRAWRIFPAFYLHLAVLFGLILPLLHGGFALLGGGLGLLNLAGHASLLQFLHPGSASSLGLNMALWSLSIEAQFYLLLPMLAPLFTGRRVLLALPAAIAVSLLWKSGAPGLLAPWLWHSIPSALLVYFDPLTGAPMAYTPAALAFFVERQLPGELMAFAFGMAGANLAVRVESSARPSGAGRRGTALLLDGLAVGLLLGWALLLTRVPFVEIFVGSTWRLFGMPALLLSVSAVVLLAHLRGGHVGVLGRALGNAPLAGIGLVSYSLFLWHEPLLRLVRAGWIALPGTWGPSVDTAVGLATALTVASLSFLLAERPWLRRR